jgi:nonribosomal peptide synthetase protein BlmVI
MATILERLSQLARTRPADDAFIFLTSGRERERLTWRALDRSARRIARLLESHGVARGDRVPIVCSTGRLFIEAFFGCLYAGAIAIPLPHDRPKRTAARLARVARDCQPAAILCGTTVDAAALVRHEAALGALTRISVEHADSANSEGEMAGIPDPDDVAFLQYTSGSIAEPKGVIVTHANLVCNEAMIQESFAHTDATVVVGWLPLFHDMGLVGNVLQPVFVGCTCVLMSPGDFIQEPLRWLDAISRYRGTTSGAPNFAYELCVSRIGVEQAASLDLSSWRVAFNGAEPIRASTLDRFAVAFARSGFRRDAFYPCYGLAEATLFVTGAAPGRAVPRARVDARAIEQHRVEDARPGERPLELVGCGRPFGGLEVAVIDPGTGCAAAPDEVGEIWIRGGSVAAGYWDQPAETEATFGARRKDVDSGPYLRTGDCGFARDGELFVTGRVSDLIVVRGRNHYPHEIEQTASEAYPGLRRDGGASFLHERDDEPRSDANGEQRLAVVLEVERHAPIDVVSAAAAVRAAVTERHDLTVHDVVFVREAGVPRTTSGKVRRRACREAYLKGTLPVVPARIEAPVSRATGERRTDGTERIVAGEIAALLGVPIASIDSGQSLVGLGLDSLMTTTLKLRLAERHGLHWSLGALLQASSVRQLARSSPLRSVRIQPARVEAGGGCKPDVSASPLSHGQRSLWFLAQLAPDSSAYHVARALDVTGELDIDRLRSALDRLATAHASLRTTFHARDGEPVQHCHDALRPGFDVRDVSDLTAKQMRELASDPARPFDLERGPLFRAVLYERAAGNHILLVVAHHLIVDLWSMRLLLRDLHTLYLSDDAVRGSDYRSFVRWQESYLSSPRAGEDLEYWRGALADLEAPLALPTDRGRPAIKSYRGAAVPVSIDRETVMALGRLACEANCTLYTVLLSIFMVLLSRWSGQSQVVVGSPAAGREDPDCRDVVGYCVNMLPLVGRIDPRATFRDLITGVHQTVVGAIAHQDCPFPLILDGLRVPRQADRSPLFDASFTWDGGVAEVAVETPDDPRARVRFVPSRLDVPQSAAQFDVGLLLARDGDGVNGYFEYNTDLMPADTAARLTANFHEIATAAAIDAGAAVGQLRMLTVADRCELHELACGPDVPIAGPSIEAGRSGSASAPVLDGDTIVSMFEAQAAATPDAVALSGALGRLAGRDAGEAMTFAALDAATKWVAADLRSRGVERGSVIGVLTPRSAALVTAIIGTLRSGGAFLPINPTDPPARIAALLSDADCRLVVTTTAMRALVPAGCTSVAIDEPAAPGVADQHASRGGSPTAADLAYVMFTSGSLGRPKGVMVEHGALVNRLRWMVAELDLDATDVFVQKTPATFDVSVWELLLPLAIGGCLVLLPRGGERDPDALLEAFRRGGVTTAHFVPSMLSAFEQHLHPATDLGGWRRCISSGEALSVPIARRWFEATHGRIALYNLYGPTEATIDVTWHRVLPGRDRVPIGRPAAGTQTHVLDAFGDLAPRGAPGEIGIAGVQIARGYLNDPSLTASVFRPDPFASGGRLYLSGDRGRWSADDTLEYLGRVDDQLKVRGWRVEPQEIEAALLGHPRVAAAAVVGRPAVAGTELLAYVVARDGEALSSDVLSAFLREHVPEALVPGIYVQIDALPLTASGKLERRRLPEPPPAARASRYEPPRTQEETTLARVWMEELGLDRVSVLDSFFDLGGDSIRAVRMIARARESGLALSVASTHRYQTIRGLVSHADPRDAVASTRPSEPFSLIPEDWRSRLPPDVEDAYPLSTVQQALVLLSQTSPDYAVYTTTLHIRARFDEDALRRSVAALVARHAFLRASFDLVTFAKPVQLVHALVATPFEVIDWRDREAADQARALAICLEGERRRVFDWSCAPMLRVTVHRRADDRMQLTLADPSLDGWCVASIVTELVDDYLTRLEQRPSTLAPPAIEYRDFVALERDAQASDDHEAFWHARLTHTRAPGWRPARSVATSENARQHRLTASFDRGVWQRVKDTASEMGVPVKSVLLAVHLAALAGTQETSRVTTGLEVNGRPETADGDRLVGVFNNMVPLTVALEGLTWRTLARHAYEAECELLPFRRYPHAALRKIARGAPFDALFVYTHFHAYDRLLSRAGLEVIEASGTDLTFVPLTAHFTVDVLGGGLRLLVDFDASEVAGEQAQSFVARCERAIAALLDDVDAPCDAAIEGGRATGSPEDVYALFAATASERPDSIALICGDDHVTYGGLHQRASSLAGLLTRYGAGPEAPIGLCMDWSVDAVAALLAVLHAGAPFVPLDPDQPRERLEAMADDSGARLLITDGRHDGRLSLARAGEIAIHDLSAQESASAHAVPSPVRRYRDSAAYVIFTSGSTGRPKGVVVPQGALVNYVRWAVEAYALRPGDPVPVHTSLSHDLTITSVFAPLASGGTLVLLPAPGGIECLAETMRAEAGCALLKATPSHLAALNRFVPPPANGAPRTLVVGGEALQMETLRGWSGATIFNEYGPTEATVGCCFYHVLATDAARGPVPIGRPIANVHSYLLDERLDLSAPGVPGEICVAGAALARGYVNDPAATALRFVPDPFAGEPGSRMYCTGDFARRLPDGDLVFIGRRDDQIKLRGCRIEPGEIESHLAAHPRVRAAAVAGRLSAAGTMQLVAFVECIGSPLRLEELRAWLEGRLPRYMIPTAIVAVDRLPLTPGGKVDRLALRLSATPDRDEDRLGALVRRVEAMDDAAVAAMLQEHVRGAGI